MFGVVYIADRHLQQMQRHEVPEQLASRASDFRSIDRRSINVVFMNALSPEEVVGSLDNTSYSPHLLISDISTSDLLSLRVRPEVLQGLSDDDERTLAVHLHEVVLNDPLRTGIKESLTDSFVDALLRDMRFGKYPLSMKLQNNYSFDVGTISVSARPEFSIERDFAVLMFDEDKHLHGRIGPSNEYGECQMSAEIVACAYHNFSQIDSPRVGMDQIIYAIRVIGSRFTFYRALIDTAYMESLSQGLPPDFLETRVFRFPPSTMQDVRFGYDYSNPSHRPIILQMLSALKTSLLNM